MRPEQLSSDIEGSLEERRQRGQIPKFWDGRTAERVLDALLET